MTLTSIDQAATEQEQTPVVTLTPSAVEKLLGIMDEKGLRATHGLRVFVGGGGCSGLQYGMTFDDNPRDADIVYEEQGLRVIVDPRSLPYITGASIDYVDSLMGGGFHIENPNAISTCGCGHSFRTSGQESAEGSGCSCH